MFTQCFQKPSPISVQHYPGDISQVWLPLSTRYTVRRDLCVCYSPHSRTHNSSAFLFKFKVWKEQQRKKNEKTKRWWKKSRQLVSVVTSETIRRGAKKDVLLCVVGRSWAQWFNLISCRTVYRESTISKASRSHMHMIWRYSDIMNVSNLSSSRCWS